MNLPVAELGLSLGRRRLRRPLLHAYGIPRLPRQPRRDHADDHPRPQPERAFQPERHFAFEGVAWDWHFVDAVWLLLFVFDYWL